MAGYIGSKASVVSSGAEHKKVFDITTTTTSLTGLVYTPTLVHVFHNGVRLVDGTDYTATSGTTITLTVAAENGDQVVVISYATFQTSDTVSASAGGTFGNSVTMDSGAVVNRTGDGTIIDLQSGGTTVGSIGTTTDNLDLDSGSTGRVNIDSVIRVIGTKHSANPRVDPVTDAAVNLGGSTNRWKDLYLSGGVYLGGTGAANHLDDYEEGTWTPIPSSGSFSSNYGTYTKVGRLVTAKFFCDFISAGVGSGYMQISGLPFGLTSSVTGYGPGLLMVDNLTTATNNMTIQPTVNSSHFILIVGNGSTGNHSGAAASLFKINSTFRGLIVYETA